MKKDVEMYHVLDDRAKEYVHWMDAEVCSEFGTGYYLKHRNGNTEFIGRTSSAANKFLVDKNPYAIWFDGDQDDEPCIRTFDTFEEMKMWAHLTRATAILEGSEEPVYYWNYSYSVNEKGGYFND